MTSLRKMEEELRKIYENVNSPAGYASAYRLYEVARDKGIKVSKQDARKFVQEYKADTLYQKKKRLPVSTMAYGLNDRWHLDIGFYKPYRQFTAFLVW